MSMTDENVRPIRLVTFDLYDTLIEAEPPRWGRMANALAALGIPADLDALRTTDRIAEDFYTEENGRLPIRERPAAERDAFRDEYAARWLAAAGLPHDPATAQSVRRRYRAEFEGGLVYRVFSDVMPALARLRAAGVKRAVISNADADVTALCTHLAFAHEMDAIITSATVGWEKPDPRTFHAALAATDTAPEYALHVGDQPRSDVIGALAIGMRAALIDRYDRHPHGEPPVLHVRDLTDLAEYVVRHNAVVGE